MSADSRQDLRAVSHSRGGNNNRNLAPELDARRDPINPRASAPRHGRVATRACRTLTPLTRRESAASWYKVGRRERLSSERVDPTTAGP